MSGRKRANKNHPDYPEYERKCLAVRDEYLPKLEEIDRAGWEKYPDWRGFEVPWEDEERAVRQEMNGKLKALKAEYSHLFTVDIED